MKRFLAPALAASFLAFCAPAFAGHSDHGMRHEMSAEDTAAFTDARIAGLKAGLKLTPAQEKNWPALETALRDVAKARAARMAEHHENMKDHEHHDVIEMLRHKASMMTERSAELTKLADAAKPLYDSLDDGQKHRFGMLMHHAMMSMHMGHHGMMGNMGGMGKGSEHDHENSD